MMRAPQIQALPTNNPSGKGLGTVTIEADGFDANALLDFKRRLIPRLRPESSPNPAR